MSLHAAISRLKDRSVLELVLITGAGLSAASGIPTFRGPEGYWTVGAKEYRPEELATLAAFQRMPRDVWRWYLYRRGVCGNATPNPAHFATAELEATLGDRFHLVTQNVDGVHLRAGNSLERTFEIHGNLDFMRCTRGGCNSGVEAIPPSLTIDSKDSPLDDETFQRLVCSSCGTRTRPHVLWFDEYYDEEHYRAESALRAGSAATVAITIGTSGATNLPHQVVANAVGNGATLIDINPEPNPFSVAAESLEDGIWVQAPAAEALPTLTAAVGSAA